MDASEQRNGLPDGADAAAVQYIYRPGWTLLEDEALWREALDYAERNGADAILAFNAHGEMPPHPELDEIRERVKLLAERFVEVKRRGMTPMLNYFVTLGHGAAKPASTMGHFRKIVDGFGNEVQGCACPLDPVFQTYMQEAFRLHAAALDVESIWIDDDFRLYGREGAETLQCFCELHLQAFASKAGRYYGRDELLQLLLEHHEPNRDIRRMWFEVQGESLIRLAGLLRDAVEKEKPGIGLGVMIPPVYYNYFSGLELNGLMRALRTDAHPAPWLRTGGGFYRDERPLDVLDKVLHVADPIPAMLNEPVRLNCEIENYPFVPGIKSAQVLALEMFLNTISTNGLLTLSIHDSFLGMHDPSGNITRTISALKPYLNRVARESQGKRRRGASLPFPPNLGEIGELTPNGFISQWNTNLARLGIPQAPTDAAPVILLGEMPDLYSDLELERMLERGALLDPEAYLMLQARGHLRDCPIRVAAEPFKAKVQTERVMAAHAPGWLKGRNLVARWHVAYDTGYTVTAGDKADIWSCLYDTEGEALSCGVAVARHPYRVAVAAHNGHPVKEAGRQWLFQQTVAFLAGNDCPAMVERVLEMYPVWWEDEQGREAILGLCYFGMERYEEVSLWLPGTRTVASLERLDAGGEWSEASCRISVHENGGNRIILDGSSVPGPLSFETFRLRR